MKIRRREHANDPRGSDADTTDTDCTITPDRFNIRQRNSYSSFEAGVAVTADKQVISSSEDRTSPLPSRTLPGYIPGMNRPMTPRDFDLDDRSHSTTPRATSPVMNNYTDSLSPSPPTGTSGLGRRESISASTVRQSPRPGTPSLFLQRSPSANGRHTPEDGLRKGDAIEFENPLNSTVLARRRPISPLSNLAASASTGSTGNATSSRPSTPSNVIWQPSLSSSIGTLKGSSHTRSDSWTSDTGSDIQGVVGVQAPQRTVRSPPVPDSPSPSNGQATFMSLGAARIATPPPDRAQVIANGMNTGNGGSDVFSSNRSQRSPTPTQNTPRSPSSPAFGFAMDRSGGSRRSSRQNATSPWGFTSTTYAPPMLNIFSNSSRTSIGSCGSSYHSWEGDKDDREWYDQILSGDEPQPVWHDLSVGRTESPLPDDQAEELLRKYFGMTMADFAAIQEKLVTFAGAKGEMVRKRRPSTSQSSYVPPGRVGCLQLTLEHHAHAKLFTKVNSPPPQIVHVPASPTAVASMSTEQYSKKASALLDSVVNDIQAKQPPPPPPPLDTTSAAVRKVSPSSPSPGTQKNQTLADVLFGPSDIRSQSHPHSDESERAPDSSATGTPNESNHSSILNVDSVHAAAEPLPGSQITPTTTHPSTPSITHSPYQLSRNSSSARVTPKNEVDLVQEVQARVAYATASLKGTKDGLTHAGSISRKRIDTSQIGTPQLVSHSNPANLETMQTIPSRSPSLSTNNNSSPSKIGSRFKKLRGTLRAKNPSPLTEELASSASGIDVKFPTSSQAANYDPARFRAPGSPALGSATEPGRSKVAVPSPPASAGPGLKGFISRFRGKPRASEPPPAADKQVSPQPLGRAPPLLPLSPRQQDSLNARTPTNDAGFTSPAPKPDKVHQDTTPLTPTVEPSPAPTPAPTHDASPSFGSRQSVMIQQLFDAANNLGLDQNALNDLLVRSGSVTTRTTKLAKTNSQAVRSNSRSGQRSETPTILEQSNSGDTSQLTIQPPSPATSRPTQSTPEPGSTKPLVFRPPPDNGRKARENRGDRAASTIVRRTIIIPDNAKAPTTDPQNAPQRANSVKRNRRGSINSGSLKDRAPTPPPPRSPVGQRFSDDGSPPVPSLPQSLASDVYLTAPRANMEKSTSTYDSSMSIVSGLRSDEDEESIYTGRASFASEYSAGTQGGQDWDNMQITVKEHARSNSKGSYSSFALKNKKQPAQGKSRPETKVYYSSTAQIGRLIENLSQGMDSGSFNFTPNSPRPGHSASSSLSTNDMTIEERLEHLLGSINRSP
ncbi:hypothetical protein P691DRAFT_247870 [Macrolepiota fuliginosa MF-IS2]|uniref:Uncharacterized protein n=1 Tax=Macrolepiota fuliginosa MF-IS2 TaxID=1400762 RepID=A0A9P6C8L1_9AGAR|nr:hypothetical protein P691DRAFT_247870 [Macrolepiota fuliginosa MF-IS2]